MGIAIRVLLVVGLCALIGGQSFAQGIGGPGYSSTSLTTIANGGTGGTNASVGIFNLDQTQLLPNIRTGLSNTTLSSRQKWLFGFESTTIGFHSSTSNYTATSYPAVVARALQAKGYPVTYQNFMGCGNNEKYASGNGDSRVVLGSGWTCGGDGSGFYTMGGMFYKYTNATAGTLDFSIQDDENACDLWYATYTGSPSFSWQIDSGSTTQVTTSGSNGFTKTTITFALGRHTLHIAYGGTNSGTGFFTGGDCYRTDVNQVDILNIGVSGQQTSNMLAGSSPWNEMNAITTFGGQAVFMNEWANDDQANVTLPTFKSNLTSIYNTLKRSGSTDLVVITGVPVSTIFSALATQQGYNATQVSAAGSTTALLDTFSLWWGYNGGQAAAPAAWYYSGDNVHQTALGEKVIGETIMSFLLGGTEANEGSAYLFNDTVNSNFVLGQSGFGQAVSQSGGGTNGQSNTGLGYETLNVNTTGSFNTALGALSGDHVTTGTHFTGVGAGAGGTGSSGAMSTGSDNTCVGYIASCGGTTSNNTTVGSQAQAGNGNSSAFGEGAQSTGNGTAIGAGAKGGNSDTAIGYQALNANTTSSGTNNVAVGVQALQSNTTGASNTAIGYQALQAGTAVTTGTNNVAVGYQAQVNSATATNRNAFGYQAISTANNDVVLGNASIATIHAEVTTITGISDPRQKTGMRPVRLGLDFIRKLNPIEYRYKTSKDIVRQGFNAEEVLSVLPADYADLVRYNGDGHGLALLEIDDTEDHYKHMAYGELFAPMVRAIQELAAERDPCGGFNGLGRWLFCK